MERSADCALYLHPGTGWGSSACGGMTLARSKSHYTGRCGVQRPEARGFNSRHLHHFRAGSRAAAGKPWSYPNRTAGRSGVTRGLVSLERVAPVRADLNASPTLPRAHPDRSAAGASFPPMTGATRPSYTEPPESRPAEAALGACSRHHPEFFAPPTPGRPAALDPLHPRVLPLRYDGHAHCSPAT